MKEERKPIKITIPYSVTKIIENRPPPYSTLKPETSSDSPSEKSKGDRFDSLNLINIHTKQETGNRKKKLNPTSQNRKDEKINEEKE